MSAVSAFNPTQAYYSSNIPPSPHYMNNFHHMGMMAMCVYECVCVCLFVHTVY